MATYLAANSVLAGVLKRPVSCGIAHKFQVIRKMFYLKSVLFRDGRRNVWTCL